MSGFARVMHDVVHGVTHNVVHERCFTLISAYSQKYRYSKTPCKFNICKGFTVEVTGFEPATFWSRTKHIILQYMNLFCSCYSHVVHK